MSIHVFVSHSSEDEAFVDLVNDALKVPGIEVLIDSDIQPGEPWEHALNSFVNAADVLLIVVSRHSLISPWVQFECMGFLARVKENPSLDVIPILLDDSPLPEFLASYQFADFRLPEKYTEKLKDLANRVINRAARAATIVSLRGQGGPKPEAELRRLQEMIRAALDRPLDDFRDQLRSMFEVFEKQQHLLTPETISWKEEMAVSEIWVVTTHLYNDTHDPEIRKSVKANLKRGIDYRYFVDTSKKLINTRIEEYRRLYAEYQDRYEFIVLPSGLIMPFDELVLYDPRERNRIWGYAQMNYGGSGKAEARLFLKLSQTNSISIAKDLEDLAP